MRYPQEGGLTAERHQFREELRLKAAERFAQDEASSVIAKDLRVSVRSVQRWRQMWDEGGPRVRGRYRRRVSIAALTCYKPGHRSRLIYRPRRDGGRKSFSWHDNWDLLISAHQQLGDPIVLV